MWLTIVVYLSSEGVENPSNERGWIIQATVSAGGRRRRRRGQRLQRRQRQQNREDGNHQRRLRRRQGVVEGGSRGRVKEEGATNLMDTHTWSCDGRNRALC